MTWRVLTADHRFLLEVMDTPVAELSTAFVTPLPALSEPSDGLRRKPLQRGFPDLTPRAMSFYNRDRKKAARYLATHLALAMIDRGRCSDAEH